MKRIWIILFLFVYAIAVKGQAKEPPFYKEVQAFKKKDSVAAAPKGAILFIGSSSFTLWKDVQDYFPKTTIVNRAFGGSSLTDVIYYADDVIFPYNPKQIIIYCGENDFAGNDSLYPAQVTDRFEQLFNMIRAKYKKVPIAYVSMKPSPSREHLKAKFNVANVMIRSFLKKKKKTVFIDVYHAMLNSDGSTMKDIFLEDKLHMNRKGYAIWQKLIAPHLLND